MKAGIFNPYLDTLGGGERYCLTVAEALLAKKWQVDIFWADELIKRKLIDKFGLAIENINFVGYSPYKNNLLQRRAFEKNYDLLFYLSDGSIPFMFGKKNILHFQVPFQDVLENSFLNKLKLNTIRKVVYNSLFTKKIIDRQLGINSEVIYPPIDVSPIKPLKKENIILGVGRFSQLLQAKRQDVLAESFINIINQKKLSGWKLILAGGTEIGGENFVSLLKEKSKGFPIEIVKNPSFTELIGFYGKAKLFWNATGFEIDENIEPQKVEHFGMTTVEAMAGGCIPLVLGKGGQKEIIKDKENGFLWFKREELEDLTVKLVSDREQMTKLSKNAILRSKDFSKENFNSKIYRILEE